MALFAQNGLARLAFLHVERYLLAADTACKLLVRLKDPKLGVVRIEVQLLPIVDFGLKLLLGNLEINGLGFC